jgi:hypothetical protein
LADLHADELASMAGFWRSCGGFALALLLLLGVAAGLGYFSGWRAADRSDQILALEGERDAAKRARAQALESAAEAGRLAEARGQEVIRLRAQFRNLPQDPGPRPVDPDATSAALVAELGGLGIRAALLDAPLALGLTLGDGRTVLFWGREARRIPFLAARLGTLEELALAQEGATGALHQQVADLTTAYRSCEVQLETERRLARLKASDRPWSAGALLGFDPSGQRHLGAYVSRSWGPIQVQVAIVGDRAAVGGGIRF